MIVVIDYGVGNLASFTKALTYLSVPFKVSPNPDDLRDATVAVLIGVGNFGGGMSELRKRRFDRAILDYVAQPKARLFGICVGMQMLFEGSEEAPGVPGLAIFPGLLRKLTPQPAAPVPHVGFDDILFEKPDAMVSGLPSGASFYFTHSYAVVDEPRVCWTAQCEHGASRFVAAIDNGRVGGVQFHPEKSQSNGLTLLKNVFSP